jgi:hypothetical protein
MSSWSATFLVEGPARPDSGKSSRATVSLETVVIPNTGGPCSLAIAFRRYGVGKFHRPGNNWAGRQCSLVVFWTSCGRIKRSPQPPEYVSTAGRTIGIRSACVRLACSFYRRLSSSRRVTLLHHDSLVFSPSCRNNGVLLRVSTANV